MVVRYFNENPIFRMVAGPKVNTSTIATVNAKWYVSEPMVKFI